LIKRGVKRNSCRYFKIPPYTILGFRNNSGVLVKIQKVYISNHAVIGLEKALGSGAKFH
jgi:hypothetical protein